MAVVLAGLLALVLTRDAAQGATFTVTAFIDNPDALTGDGMCATIGQRTPVGPCT